MKGKWLFVLAFAGLGVACSFGVSGAGNRPGAGECVTVNGDRPRVVVMTDGEVDDRCSMVHFLLSTNDLDVQAIIQSNSCFQRHGWSSIHWLEKQIDDYEKAYPNLAVHDAAYPTPDYLRSVCFVGDEDESHIPERYSGAMTRPGEEPRIDPSLWPDTPGSERILELLLDSDPRTLYLCAWGGSNTAARAFWKLREDYPDRYQQALSKVVMYNIWYQDGAGSYIERNFPMVTMLLSYNFSGTWDYDSQRYMDAFVRENLRGKFGDLSTNYVQDVCSEGDSPSFFYLLGNGLRSYENPAFGGWGGQFHPVEGMPNVYVDNDKGSYFRWTEYVNRDFEARLRWCTAEKYEDANHRPRITLESERYMTVHSGDTVKLAARVEDHDGVDAEAIWRSNIGMAMRENRGIRSLEELKDKLDGELKDMVRFSSGVRAFWWQYPEAGTYKGFLDLPPMGPETRFVAPEVSSPETIHLILEATDRDTPPMSAFERVVVTVLPR